jgi:hypothetical protein
LRAVDTSKVKGDGSMKTLLFQILAGVVLCGYSPAQGGTAPPANTGAQPSQQVPATRPDESNSGQATGAPRIAPGSVIPVQLTKTIDAKKVKTGDEIEARVTQDLKSGNGDVVVPKDTKVMGHVTEAQAHNKEQKESQVGIAFDRAIMKNGSDVTLPMSIQAIIGPRGPSAGNNDAADNVSQPSPTQGGGGMSPSNNGGHSAGMGASVPSQAPTPSAGEELPTQAQGGTKAQPITANTQGVVGISNLHLSTAANTTEGSLVTSEKNNVKLDSGTLLLLRVNQ